MKKEKPRLPFDAIKLYPNFIPYVSKAEHKNYFPCRSPCILFFLDCLLIVKAVIMNFWEDRDVCILHLSTMFELDQSTNN